MSTFGDNYKKNDLVDNIQYFFSEGGTLTDMFDVLKYVFEYGTTSIDELEKENKQLQNNWNELKKWLEEMIEHSINDIQKGTLKLTLLSMQELEGNNECI